MIPDESSTARVSEGCANSRELINVLISLAGDRLLSAKLQSRLMGAKVTLLVELTFSLLLVPGLLGERGTLLLGSVGLGVSDVEREEGF